MEFQDWADLDFADAGRAVENEARAKQEAAWADTNVDARQILGAREAQREYLWRFRSAFLDLLTVRTLAAGMLQEPCPLRRITPVLFLKILEIAETNSAALMKFATEVRSGADTRREMATSGAPFGRIEICVRKRPLLPCEAKGGEWDCVEVLSRDSALICHDGRLSRSHRHLLMTHRHFTLDRIWGPTASTDVVYQDVVRPRVEAALRGCGATLFCTGQTGTGKTYTICGVAECLARDIEALGSHISVEFFEIYGKKCCDLLGGRKEVFLRSDEEDRVHVRGQQRVELPGGQGLAAVVADAMQLRACEETERNAASSRSHAICTLHLGSQGGILRLVDLAGSERNFETTKMTAQQHREGAEINASLMVLKDCFRAHAALQRGEKAMLPYRRSRLTRVLRDCFADPTHSTAVIATISPSATDVIHTTNTLNHVTMLSKVLADLCSEVTVELTMHSKGAYKDRPVSEWSPSDVMAWMQEAEGGRFAHVVVPPDLDGRRLLTTGSQGLADLFEGELRRARQDQEGEAWNVAVDGVGARLGRDIFAAARRTAIAQSE